MIYEQDGSSFAEISTSQMEAFEQKVNDLRPLLSIPDIDVSEVEGFDIGTDEPGEYMLGLTDEGMEGVESPKIIGGIAVKNLGGLVELGPGIVISTDPFKYTNEKHSASFLVGDQVVEVIVEKNTAQNLRYPEDLTGAIWHQVRTTTFIESEEFEHSLERRFDCNARNEQAQYSETLYRRPKAKNGQKREDWVEVASPGFFEMVDKITSGVVPTSEEYAVANDQTIENNTRFDQNRFSDVMDILAQIDSSKRLYSRPEAPKQTSFKIVRG